MNIPLPAAAAKMLLLCLLAALPAIAGAQWTAKICLTPNATTATLNENMATCLAAGGSTVHVVWSEHRAAGTAIYYRQSVDSGFTWSTEMPVTTMAGGSATFPAIAVSGTSVHIVWMDTSLGHRASFYKRSLDNGVTWGAAFCLDSNTKFWPGLASSGPMVVVSLNKEVVTGNTEVYFRRSMNNGAAWDTLKQISNAPDRSEDPAIAALGSDVHLSWNDKRSGTMQTYYRHSADAGITWGPETPLNTFNSYTTMVSLSGPYVDVPYGSTLSGNFDVWMRQSADKGSTWGPAKQLTNDPVAQVYPYMVRSGSSLHLVYQGSGAWYLHSGDGGATWDSGIFLAHGGQPFIAVTGCILHAINVDSGKIYYVRNPTGNCKASATTAVVEPEEVSRVKCYPNPFHAQTTFELSGTGKMEDAELKIYDLPGREVLHIPFGKAQKVILNKDMLKAGVYVYRVLKRGKVVATGEACGGVKAGSFRPMKHAPPVIIP